MEAAGHAQVSERLEYDSELAHSQSDSNSGFSPSHPPDSAEVGLPRLQPCQGGCVCPGKEKNPFRTGRSVCFGSAAETPANCF